MIQAVVLSDASTEAVISGILAPLLKSAFGEGGFFLLFGINREFNREFFCFELVRVLIPKPYWGFGCLL